MQKTSTVLEVPFKGAGSGDDKMCQTDAPDRSQRTVHVFSSVPTSTLLFGSEAHQNRSSDTICLGKRKNDYMWGWWVRFIRARKALYVNGVWHCGRHHVLRRSAFFTIGQDQ